MLFLTVTIIFMVLIIFLNAHGVVSLGNIGRGFRLNGFVSFVTAQTVFFAYQAIEFIGDYYF